MKSKSNFKHLYEIQVGNIYKIALIILCLFIFSNSNASDYYVDNIGGNNANNGNSTANAWSDFTNVNARTFLPGDHIFLKSGCVWNSELRLKGSGTSSNFIILDSYGTGNKPKIQRNGQVNDRTVFLDDVSYFKLRNIEVCNAGDGIRLNYTIKGKTSVYFENLYIHNIDLIVNASPASIDNVFYSTGIVVSSAVSKPTSVNDYVATDIRITNCEIAFTTAPITFFHAFSNPTSANTESPWSYKNVLIDNNHLHDFKGPISSRDMNNSLITNNFCKNGGTSALPQGTTGFFNFNLENIIFEGNVLDNIPNTGSADQTWIDNEAYCNNVQLYGNLIKNTAGSGIEFLALGGGQPPRGSDDYNTNNICDGNSFYNNATGALKSVVFTGGVNPTGIIQNNTYQSGNTFFSGTISGFTQNNNTVRQNTQNLALYKSYIASSNYDNNQRASKAFDGSSTSNWQSASNSFANQWLRINFEASTSFDKIILSEFGNRTSGFRIEYSNDGITWQTAHTGTTIGTSKTINFTAVTGKMARVYFTGGSSSPVIYEFEIYTSVQSPSGTNLASNKTYSSSSNWDASQTAVKGFDGNYNTVWQSANGTGFANQWLQVNFGAATIFDKVILSEYGDRTTGYRIEYSTNGTTWQTAYTGTTIGTTKTITFSPVTGNYARIFYTSGANTPIVYEFEIYNNPPVSSANLALNRTYASSSNWDNIQTAGKACDALTTTIWQAGSGFVGQWLQVNFGASTTFNSVTLSEYGDRTSGYRIEYSTDGTNWQTAYTGTTIGTTKTVNFPAVTGNYARIYYTAGIHTPIVYEFEIYNNPPISSANLALNRTYASSSNWDNTQTAEKACDALTTTIWQAGSGFVGQWLQVNFGASTTFNSVTLSEYGDRTSGYRIEYSTDGTNWQTAYTGTTIGTTKTVNFPAVTGNYARIYYTAGIHTPIVYEFEIYNTASPTRMAAEGSDERLGFEVYPNPSGDVVNISYNLTPNSEAELSVFDMMGKTVKQINFNTANDNSGKISVDVSRFKSGVYFINIDSDGKSFAKKIIVEK